VKLVLSIILTIVCASFTFGQEKSGLSAYPPLDTSTKVPEAAKELQRGISLIGISGGRAKAIRHFTRAIRLDPKYALAYNYRGASYMDTDRIDKAIADFSRAIKLDPTYVTPRLNRGTAYHMYKKEYDKAIDDFTALIAMDPTIGVYYMFRAEAYQAAGKPELAAADRKKRLELRKKGH
jgi:tetratricopeptide (TPR) repeat protein